MCNLNLPNFPLQNVARSNGSGAWRRTKSIIADRIGVEQGYRSQQKYGAATNTAERSNQGAEARNKYIALEYDTFGPREGSAVGKWNIVVNCIAILNNSL